MVGRGHFTQALYLDRPVQWPRKPLDFQKLTSRAHRGRVSPAWETVLSAWGSAPRPGSDACRGPARPLCRRRAESASKSEGLHSTARLRLGRLLSSASLATVVLSGDDAPI